MRWPLMGSKFNARDYTSTAMIIDDIETILETSLQDSFDISRREYKVPLRFTPETCIILRHL